MKAAIVSLALVGLGTGLYSGLGHADPPGPAGAKPATEPPGAAKAAERFHDPLPPGSTMRLGTSRFRQGVTIVAMAVSADSKSAFVVCGTQFDGSVRAFDLTTGLPAFMQTLSEAEAVALAPDGRTFVIKSNLHLYVCDTGTGRELRTIELPKPNPRSEADVLAITPDGKAVVTISDGKVAHLIDYETGRPIRDFPHEGWGVRGVAFSPDGKLMAAGGYDEDKDNYYARLWEVETAKELRRFVHGPHAYGIRQLAFSPDGKTLATGTDDGRLRLFDVDSGNLRRVFPKDGRRRTRGVAFSPDGKTVAAAGDSLRLYDVATGDPRLRIDRGASHLHFSSDGKTLTGAVDGAICRWDAATGQLLTPEGSDGVVRQILVTPDGGRIVTNTYAGGVVLWDGATGKRLRELTAGWTQRVVCSPDGRYLAWAVDDDAMHIRLFDLAANRLVERIPPIRDSRGSVVLTFTPDSKAVITFDQQTAVVRLWDVETGKERRGFQAIPEALRKNPDRQRRAVASPDGKTLAVAGDEREPGGVDRLGKPAPPPDTIRLWDIATGRELRRLDGNQASLAEMAFSPDGRLLATSGEVWDVATGKRVAELTEGLPISAFSSDGRLMARASNDGTITLWETATWTERAGFRGHHKRVSALAFTPGGQLLCAGSDTTVLGHDVRPRPGEAAGTVEAAWNDLRQQDARRAFQAQRRLLAMPAQTVRLFAERIKPVEPADPDLLRRLITGLGDAKFAARETASKALFDLGEKARPALGEAARTSASPEVAERAKKILDELPTMSPDQIPRVRAVEVLELIASDEATDLLKQWAGGVPGAVLTDQSRAALGRQNRSATGLPIRR